ncbi:MAG: polysaccharide deacetylase family protein [Candidatus Promineofilum sp.]|nr:polysaccharide deacetylase family protein [Promineifilum sp.]
MTVRCLFRSQLLVLLLGLAAGGLLIGCGGDTGPEPAAVISAEEPADGSAALPAINEPIIRTLPSPAATLSPPPSPTPAPTMTGDPFMAATAAIIATQTAAANPPTPPISGSTPAPSLMNEPMPTPSGIYSWTLKVPILMYHYISEPPPDSDVYRVDLSVAPEAFRQQMAYLKDNGYTPIDFYDLSTAIVAQTELPEKPILLTFDDGYLDSYEVAYPILREYGFKGTFFIITEFVDSGREGYMTWPMIEEMAQAGQGFESHSRTHPDLATKSHDGLIWEILGAQETLAAHVGYRPRYFCYPGGTYNEETIQMLQELDYWGAVTTENGSWHGFNDRFEWRRVRMRNTTTIEEFQRLIDLEGTVSGKQPG